MPASKRAKSKFIRGFKTEAENHAIGFRNTLNLAPHDCLSARILAEHLCVPILCPKDISGLNDTHLKNVLKQSTKGGWSAVTLKPDGKLFILLNNSHASTRQESDIMHELAHIIRGHEMSAIANRKGFPPMLLRDYDPIQESEAEWLGGCLQIPREALVWAVKKNMTIPEIANHYRASEKMATFRINKEGIRYQFKSWKGYLK